MCSRGVVTNIWEHTPDPLDLADELEIELATRERGGRMDCRARELAALADAARAADAGRSPGI